MTHIYLVRHATNDLVSKAIAGRQPGVHLNAEGRKQAEAVAEFFEKLPIQQIFSSPLERARETAEPIAKRLGQDVQTAGSILEIDFGEWTGETIANLEKDERWKRWNQFRSGHHTPGGETSIEVQSRFVRFVLELCEKHPDESVILVSHGDPIRFILMYFLGMPSDLFDRIEVSPASISLMTIGPETARVMMLNYTPWKP